MAKRVGLYSSTYGHFEHPALAAVRRATYGEDFGQNSWTTADEYARLIIPALQLAPDAHVLEVASGSGGPSLHLARKAKCRVTGIDLNEHGVATATTAASRLKLNGRARFQVADANARLPFEDASFDGLVCIDSMNHFPNRLAVLREFHRVLRPGRRAVYTDPIVITGALTNEEVARRSSIGVFLFTAPGVNEAWIQEAGLTLLRKEDVTANAALVAGRWRAARDAHRDELVPIEGEKRFEALQEFFDAVHRLSGERRLSRILYVVQKPAPAV